MSTIQSFMNSHIAFFRPRKRVYFLLEWNVQRNKWTKYTGEPRNFSLHKSATHVGQVSASITYANNRGRGSPQTLRITTEGYFLKHDTMIVPIVETTAVLPSVMRGTEYTGIAPANTDEYVVQQNLWRLHPPPALVPDPPRPPVILKRKVPIPRRIAWLIAEDAQKQGETCAITMEDISPLTAAVTTCFHVFNADALNQWVERHRTQPVIPCPVCRKNFTMQKAYEDTANSGTTDNPIPVS